MKRNKILFSGSSNTLGLGLEFEFRPRYNNHEWLLENGINLPDITNIRTPKDQKIWKKYRWTKLVCEELGYEEFNIHDDWAKKYDGLGGYSTETIWYLQQKPKFSELMDSVKYVILEIGGIRWWDKELHGKDKKYPNTVTEVVNFIEDGNNTQHDRSKALRWLEDYDEFIYASINKNKLIKLQKLYPEVIFLKLPWFHQKEIDSTSAMIDHEWEKNFVFEYLQKNKMTIGDTAMCFNGDYKYTYKDDHANAEGHKWVASKVIKHIRKLENVYKS